LVLDKRNITMALASRPIAVRKLTRLPTGQMSVSFVDAETGQVIPEDQLGAYEVVDQAGQDQSLQGLGLSPTQPTPQEEDTTSQEVISGTDTDSDHVTTKSPAKKEIKDSVESTKGDFGYIDKPGILGMASAFSNVAKVADVAINAKNVHAVGKAREEAGLKPRGMLEKVKNTLMGQDDYVGDAIIGDNQYSVGLGALDPAGRTTLTPSEARQRGLRADGVQTATRDQTMDAINAFRKDGNPPREETGIVSNAKNAISDFFNNLFNGDQEEQVEYAGEDYYPDAPEPSKDEYVESPTNVGIGGSSIDYTPAPMEDPYEDSGSTTEETSKTGSYSNGMTGLF
jgi:hypothetical protein